MRKKNPQATKKILTFKKDGHKESTLNSFATIVLPASQKKMSSMQSNRVANVFPV
jgi:hypothetical protein